MDHRTNTRPHLWGMECREDRGRSDLRIRAWWATSRQPEGAMSKHMPAEWWTGDKLFAPATRAAE